LFCFVYWNASPSALSASAAAFSASAFAFAAAFIFGAVVKTGVNKGRATWFGQSRCFCLKSAIALLDTGCSQTDDFALRGSHVKVPDGNSNFLSVAAALLVGKVVRFYFVVFLEDVIVTGIRGANERLSYQSCLPEVA